MPDFVDTLIEDNRWAAAGLADLAAPAAMQTLTHLGFDPSKYEISLLGCDDTRIAVLNADFRDKLTPTNVLSWPAEDLAPETPGERPFEPEADFPDMPIEL
ncbi:MAG: rRNA maturation RNAse YbeY, partial [Pseudoruegeria sp.]